MLKLLIFFASILGGVILAMSWWTMTIRHAGPLELSADGSEPLHLILVGDTGTGNGAQQAVAQAMERLCQQEPVTAIVMLGDNFYQNGVQSVNDPQWDEKVFKPYGGPCLQKAPIYAALGNHDYHVGIDPQLEKGKTARRWNMPNRFYDVHFNSLLDLIVLDTQVLDWCGISTLCTFDFLKRSLDSSKARWKLVVGHHPILNSDLKYSDEVSYRSWMMKTIMKPLLCAKATAYVSGHSHHLEHAVEANCPAQFFISGGGGGDLYAVRAAGPSPFKLSSHGFLSLRVAKDELVWRFFDTQNHQVYKTIQN